MTRTNAQTARSAPQQPEPTTAIVSFDFEASEVRVIPRDGSPWFVLADVCRVLETEQPHHVAARLDDDEKGRDTVTTPGGPQEMTIINESGLYSLILTSRKPAAKRFKKWVTSEVLPAIRKTGQYSAAAKSQAKATPAPAAKAAVAQMELINMLIDSTAALALQVAALSQRGTQPQQQPDPAETLTPQGRVVHLPAEGQRFHVICKSNGETQVIPADGYALVAYADERSLMSFLKEVVPADMLGAALHVIGQRTCLELSRRRQGL